jgi:hypothetical protein
LSPAAGPASPPDRCPFTGSTTAALRNQPAQRHLFHRSSPPPVTPAARLTARDPADPALAAAGSRLRADAARRGYVGRALMPWPLPPSCVRGGRPDQRSRAGRRPCQQANGPGALPGLAAAVRAELPVWSRPERAPAPGADRERASAERFQPIGAGGANGERVLVAGYGDTSVGSHLWWLVEAVAALDRGDMAPTAGRPACQRQLHTFVVICPRLLIGRIEAPSMRLCRRSRRILRREEEQCDWLIATQSAANWISSFGLCAGVRAVHW